VRISASGAPEVLLSDDRYGPSSLAGALKAITLPDRQSRTVVEAASLPGADLAWASLSPDGALLAVPSGSSHPFRLLDPSDGHLVREVNSWEDFTHWSPEGTWLANSRGTALLEVATGKIHSLTPPADHPFTPGEPHWVNDSTLVLVSETQIWQVPVDLDPAGIKLLFDLEDEVE
jgi:hypothetical protein